MVNIFVKMIVLVFFLDRDVNFKIVGVFKVFYLFMSEIFIYE